MTAQETIKASSLMGHTITKKQSGQPQQDVITSRSALNTTHTSQTAASEQILLGSRSKDIKHKELPAAQAAIFPST